MKNMLDSLIDNLYREKRVCAVCGHCGDTVEKYICGECREKLPLVGYRRCSICGKSTYYADEGVLRKCRDCERYPKSFEKGVSPLEYRGIVKKLIYDFKYHDRLHLKKLFSELIIEELLESDMEDHDLVLGVPLSRERENTRGYNQAELLSDYIGKKLGIKSGEGFVTRVKETGAQKELGKTQRLKNLHGAFRVDLPEKIRSKKVLLVDDIYTTGATLEECAKTLMECGASAVNIATIATAVERMEE